MTKNLLVLLGMLIFISLISCNIFEPNEIDSSKYYTQSGEFWILEGKKKMQDKNWIGALSDFEEALQYRNNDGKKYSEAYFYIGKCILRISDVDLGQVWDEVNPGNNSNNVPFLYNPENAPDSNVLSLLGSGKFNMDIYNFEKNQHESFSVDTLIDSVFLERKRIYDAMSVAIRYLDTIHYNEEDMDGLIRREHYESDYLIEISVTMVLGITDINNNGFLDFYSDERKAFKILSQDVPNLDEMELDSLKTISKNPNEIKENLDLILYSLELADTSYNKFNNELKGADMDTAMVVDIGAMIHNFKKILPYFYYDDYIDNDDDWYNTNGNETEFTVNGVSYPKNDRMIWIDWDQDTLIDIHSPLDTATMGHIHIGDSIHRALNPDLYESVDLSDSTYNRYKYKGSYNYEFIGGDWGSDEEMMDGHDNDQDGLVDEDTRNVSDTLDDDGDWYNTDNSVLNDSNFNPLIWIDNNNNGILDISLTSNWIKVPISSQFKNLHSIGYSIQYNIVLPDSINSYTGTYSDEFTGADYGIDEEWYDGIDNDGDGLTDEDVNESRPPESLRQAIIDKLTTLGLRG